MSAKSTAQMADRMPVFRSESAMVLPGPRAHPRQHPARDHHTRRTAPGASPPLPRPRLASPATHDIHSLPFRSVRSKVAAGRPRLQTGLALPRFVTFRLRPSDRAGRTPRNPPPPPQPATPPRRQPASRRPQARPPGGRARAGPGAAERDDTKLRQQPPRHPRPRRTWSPPGARRRAASRSRRGPAAAGRARRGGRGGGGGGWEWRRGRGRNGGRVTKQARRQVGLELRGGAHKPRRPPVLPPTPAPVLAVPRGPEYTSAGGAGELPGRGDRGGRS